MNDTICAIATTTGISAINIIKISGEDSIKIVNNIFNGKNLLTVKPNTINYGKIFYEEEIIDEVLVSIFHQNKSYTNENVVEINCHGGIAVTNKILEILLIIGCRLAEPGEFTKRAVLNGRIDLTQVDGIMNMIEAKTEKQRIIAANQINKKTTLLIENLRKKLVDIIANIEVNIDYPEYEDILEITNELLTPKLKELILECQNIIKKSEEGLLIINGIKLGIIGRPNVGKSSLLNCLLEEEKAIVTNIAGTTRDIVEGMININGVLFNLIDTAGIRTTNNEIEQIGIDKSKEVINTSDLIILMFNYNEKMSLEDYQLLELTKDKKRIIIVNKSDLDKKIDLSIIEEVIYTTTKDKKTTLLIKEIIKQKLNIGDIEVSDYQYLTSTRSIALLKKALNELNIAYEEVLKYVPVDMTEINIKQAWNYLGEIIGKNYSEELLDNLFSNFCLGK